MKVGWQLRLSVLVLTIFSIIFSTHYNLVAQDFIKYLRINTTDEITPVQKTGDLILAYSIAAYPDMVYLIDHHRDSIIFYKALDGDLVTTKFFPTQDVIYIATNAGSTGKILICRLGESNYIEEQRTISPQKLLSAYFFNDSKRIAFVDQNYKFYIINLENGEIELDFADFSDQTIYSFNISRDEKTIVLLGGSKICTWDISEKRMRKEFPVFSYHIEKVYLTNNSKYIIKYGYDKTLRIYDIDGDSVLAKISNLELDVIVCQTDETDSWLFCLLKGRILKVYTFPELNEIWKFSTPSKNFVVETDSNKQVYLYSYASYTNHQIGILKYNIQEKNSEVLYHFLNIGQFDIDVTRDFIVQRYYTDFQSFPMRLFLFDLHSGKFIKEISQDIINNLDSRSASTIRFFDNQSVFYYYNSDTLVIRDIATEEIIAKYFIPNVRHPRDCRLAPNLKYFFYIPLNNDCPKVVDLTSGATIYSFTTIDTCVKMYFEQVNNQNPLNVRIPQLVYFSNNGKFLGYFRLSALNQKVFEIVNLHTGQSVFQKIFENKFNFFFDPEDERYFYFRADSFYLAKYDLETEEITFFKEEPKNYYKSQTSSIYKIPGRNLLVEIYKPQYDFKFWDTERLNYAGMFPIKTQLKGLGFLDLEFRLTSDNSPILIYFNSTNTFAIYVDSLINHLIMDTSMVNNIPEIFSQDNTRKLAVFVDDVLKIDLTGEYPISNQLKLFDIFAREIDAFGRININQSRIYISLKGLTSGFYYLVGNGKVFCILKI